MRSIGFAATLAATVSAGFDAASSSNVAIYWGQGDSQITLPEVCSDPSVDIVNLAFVNEFPTAVGQYPGSNFGIVFLHHCGTKLLTSFLANACEPEWYTLNGQSTKLNSNCPLIGPGIQKCHDNGKKVFLSLGGGVPTDYSLPSREIAEYFADFLWGAYGPSTPEWKAAGKPRPFGDVSVDGFDLDLEALIPSATSNEYQYINYDHFVNQLRSNYASSAGKYYISGAPQCITPDVRMAYAIQRSHFDFLFVQFYNTPQCNTRRGYESLGQKSTDFTFGSWVTWVDAHSANQQVKIYLGMPASTQAVPSDPSSYLTPTEAEKLINAHRTTHPTRFGGVMLWEATKSKRNPICGKPYATYIRSILDGKFTNEVCTDTSSSLPSSDSSAGPSSTAISPDGSCGPDTGYTCTGSIFGGCCSAYGYCGSASIYCDVAEGCQSLFGTCSTSSSSISVPPFPTIANSTTIAGPTGTQSSILLTTGHSSSTISPFPEQNNSTVVSHSTGSPVAPFPTGNNSTSILAGTSSSIFSTGTGMYNTASPTAVTAPSSQGNSSSPGLLGTTSSIILIGTGNSIVASFTSLTAPFPTRNSSSSDSPGIASSTTFIGTGISIVSSSASTISPLPTGNNPSTVLPGTSSSSVGSSGAFLASPQSTHGIYANTTHPAGYKYMTSTINGAVQSSIIPFASSISVSSLPSPVTSTTGQTDSAAATSTSTVYTSKLPLAPIVWLQKRLLTNM